MGKYRKYPKLINAHNTKALSWWYTNMPELVQPQRWVVTEKLHGANFQVIFNGNDVTFGKRNNILKPGEGFYDFNIALEPIHGALQKIKTVMLGYYGVVDFTLHGELFGPGVQKGVDYGPKKQIRFFDIFTEVEYLSPKRFSFIMGQADCTGLMVPLVECFEGTLDDFEYDISVVKKSIFYKEADEDNCLEGVVIRPWNITTLNPNKNEMFALKIKWEKFLEKDKEIRSPKPAIGSHEVLKLMAEFNSFINENRIDSVFSKEGSIQRIEDIGKYIRWVINDAEEDFKDQFGEEFEKLSSKEKKLVKRNAGRNAAILLKKELGVI